MSAICQSVKLGYRVIVITIWQNNMLLNGCILLATQSGESQIGPNIPSMMFWKLPLKNTKNYIFCTGSWGVLCLLLNQKVTNQCQIIHALKWIKQCQTKTSLPKLSGFFM